WIYCRIWAYFVASDYGCKGSTIKPCAIKNAQQSVHWTGGIRRHFQAFFWLRVFPAPEQSPRPPQRQ
ncbi:MAG: hypothetical protein WBD62_20755, partial [Anaerolineales bacterium]